MVREKKWVPPQYENSEIKRKFNLDDYEPDGDPGGIYIFRASKTEFLYPLGISRVFYIGQTGGHRESGITRLEDHKRWMAEAKKDLDEGQCASRRHPHEGKCVTENQTRPYLIYGARFGAEVTWISRRGRQGPASMESDLINKFYQHYGACPVGNSQWPRLRAQQGNGP